VATKKACFEPSPRENPYATAVARPDQGENLGFSTFFSTVVENLGGDPMTRGSRSLLAAPCDEGIRQGRRL